MKSLRMLILVLVILAATSAFGSGLAFNTAVSCNLAGPTPVGTTALGGDDDNSSGGGSNPRSPSEFICGDVDGSGEVTWDDVTYLIDFYFLFGDAPDPYESGDLNLDGVVDITDLVWLGYYLNDFATPPCYDEPGRRDFEKSSGEESEF